MLAIGERANGQQEPATVVQRSGIRAEMALATARNKCFNPTQHGP